MPRLTVKYRNDEGKVVSFHGNVSEECIYTIVNMIEVEMDEEDVFSVS